MNKEELLEIAFAFYYAHEALADRVESIVGGERHYSKLVSQLRACLIAEAIGEPSMEEFTKRGRTSLKTIQSRPDWWIQVDGKRVNLEDAIFNVCFDAIGQIKYPLEESMLSNVKKMLAKVREIKALEPETTRRTKCQKQSKAQTSAKP